MIERLSARVIAIIVGAGLLLLVAAFFLHQWQNARTNAAKARLSTNQAQAGAMNAKDAIGATGAVSARQQASDDLTRSNADEIHHAKGADAPVDPAATAAGLRSLCRRASAAGDPKCLQFTAPR